MDIKEIQEALKLNDVADAFKASCDAKAKFFEQLRGVVADLAPSVVKKAALAVDDFELGLQKYTETHKYDNYQFRYNKKYTTTVLFVPDGKMNIGVHDNLVFKGRKSDKPEYLVFEVSREVAEGEAAPEPFRVELLDTLFIEWLKFGLVH